MNKRYHIPIGYFILVGFYVFLFLGSLLTLFGSDDEVVDVPNYEEWPTFSTPVYTPSQGSQSEPQPTWSLPSREPDTGVELGEVEPTEPPYIKEIDSSIDNFSYSLEGEKILLSRYKGTASIVEIDSSYTIDGTEYKTDLRDFQVGAKSVKNIIFHDGITYTNLSTFNGSNVENIYFPKSMVCVFDYTLSYLHLRGDNEHINIFYEGTREDWGRIFTEYHNQAQVNEITGYDPDLGEATGKAAADFLNGFFRGLNGEETYDSSLFAFYFESSPDELK